MTAGETPGPRAMRVGVSARGVEVEDGQGGVLAPWSDVHRVTAFALDAVVSTVRYVSFDLVNGHSVEVDDAAPEWDEVVTALPDVAELAVADLPAALGALVPGSGALVLAEPARSR
ncbi:hypothetical protein H1Q78_10670 [Cellulosimicrobium cellulans]|uniref:hypothetical protein n=1 Tax=Cellulosimicrobium cellulans TaxID=1710 RepID=UPI001ED9EAE5|nr:hypothetical protein [Cellulosimicrobium cellulans]UKJ62292.1 hypothetical protein H1Q78_10670 [Cellulosimicrobium cellulans]